MKHVSVIYKLATRWISIKMLIFLGAVIALVILFVYLTASKGIPIDISPYPNGKNFAFTITDDPDYTKTFKIRPIYNFLDSIGIKTTIAAWVKNPDRSNGIPDVAGKFYYGDTCEIPNYFNFLKTMHQKGFEIALHTVSGGNDRRDFTIDGYERFKELFGSYPKINIMHAENLENVYWGSQVVKNRLIRRIVEYLYPKAALPFSGEDEDSPYFWGDVLRAKTKYVRLWGTEDINTLKFTPDMPYHDTETPYVNYWFSFSDGYSPTIFNKLLSQNNIARLAKERGTCIVYTHFANGFTQKNEDGKRVLDMEFQQKMEYLASREDGWFVPASTILDRLLAVKHLDIIIKGNTFSVVNMNESDVDGVTILVESGAEYYSNGKRFKSNVEGEIIIGRIGAKSIRTFSNCNTESQLQDTDEKHSLLNQCRILYERSKLLIKHRFFKKEFS